MASLSHPHWEAVPHLLRELLAEIGQMPFAGRFYLAGGTALALQLGHRVSVDLDFSSDVDETDWETAKDFFVAEARRLGRLWFET